VFEIVNDRSALSPTDTPPNPSVAGFSEHTGSGVEPETEMLPQRGEPVEIREFFRPDVVGA
jgi:hypothetical protein